VIVTLSEHEDSKFLPPQESPLKTRKIEPELEIKNKEQKKARERNRL
jgi:hypothetical protein